MRFIQVTDSESDNAIFLNHDKIELMCKDDDRTFLLVAGKEFMVKESPEQIMKGERYSGWKE